MDHIFNWWLGLSLQDKILTLVFLPFMPIVMLFAWAFPHLLAPTVRPANDNLPTYYLVETPIRSVGAHGTLTIRVPNVIRVSRITVVKASIRIDEGEPPSALQAKLAGVGLEILESRNERNSHEWTWTWFVSFTSSDPPAEPTLKLEFEPTVTVQDTLAFAGSNLVVSDAALTAKLTPIDELGLTQLQNLIFTVVGGVIGLALSIVGAIRIYSRHESRKRAQSAAE